MDLIETFKNKGTKLIFSYKIGTKDII